MDELPTWKTWTLKNWRERNGYTTPEWIAYRDAVSIQDTIFTLIISTSCFVLGYIAGSGRL